MINVLLFSNLWFHVWSHVNGVGGFLLTLWAVRSLHHGYLWCKRIYPMTKTMENSTAYGTRKIWTCITWSARQWRAYPNGLGRKIFTNVRIGHTYFSHSYILRREDPPECTACQEIYSVRDVLIDCIDLGLIRPRFYSVPDMKTLFDTVSVDRIISFVKEINLFSKI